jgi:hypothetical protein
MPEYLATFEYAYVYMKPILLFISLFYVSVSTQTSRGLDRLTVQLVKFFKGAAVAQSLHLPRGTEECHGKPVRISSDQAKI